MGLGVWDVAHWIRIEILCGVAVSRAPELLWRTCSGKASNAYTLHYVCHTCVILERCPQPKPRVAKDPGRTFAPDTWSKSSATSLWSSFLKMSFWQQFSKDLRSIPFGENPSPKKTPFRWQSNPKTTNHEEWRWWRAEISHGELKSYGFHFGHIYIYVYGI